MALADLSGLAIVLVVATITIAMGSLVLSEVQDTSTITSGSYADNATTEGLSGLDTAAGFLPVIAIVVVAAIIIGIVANSFRGTGGL